MLNFTIRKKPKLENAKYASEIGIEVLGITDHETINKNIRLNMLSMSKRIFLCFLF